MKRRHIRKASGPAALLCAFMLLFAIPGISETAVPVQVPDEVTDRLSVLDGIVQPEFEAGGFNASTGTMMFSERNDRIRIRDRKAVRLSAGDEIYTDPGAEFELAYLPDGSEKWIDSGKWYTAYTADAEARYLIMLRCADDPFAEIGDPSELSGKLHIRRRETLSGRLAELETDMEAVREIGAGMSETGRELKETITGVLDGKTGEYPAASAYQEITAFDMAAGETYTFTVTLTDAPDDTVYLYLIDGEDGFIESDGCVSMISAQNTTAAFSKTAEAEHTGVRFALKAARGCRVSAAAVSAEHSMVSRLSRTEDLADANRSGLEAMQAIVFDSTGKAVVKDRKIYAGDSYQPLCRVDLKAGTAYTLTLELAAPAEKGPLYCYLLDPEGNPIGSEGSLTGIPEGRIYTSCTVAPEASCEDVCFAVKCPESTVEIAEASISYTPGGDEQDPIPDYYFTDQYLQKKTDRINELAMEAGADGDIFLFITDCHLKQNVQKSPALIRYISESTHISRMFDAGDDYDGGNESWARKIRKAFGGKVYFTMGNHEWFENRTGGELYYMYDSVNNEQVGNPERHYYYVDDVQVKTRYIVLSAYSQMEKDQGYIGAHIGYEEEQIDWFKNTALNVEPGWTMIIITHALFYGDYDTHAWYLPSYAWPVIEAADSYEGNGKIAFMMQGHLHADGINYTPGGIPVIATTCDKQDHWIDTGVDMEGFLSGRVAGTTTEQAFDVVIHNKRTRTITCVRIGGFATFNGEGNEELLEAGERVLTY